MRSETSLIQTIGRAARNADGQVIMYADSVTRSMENAINETNRRRAIQDAYNKANGITPQTIIKDVREVIEMSSKVDDTDKAIKKMPKIEREKLIAKLSAEMREAAKMLEFEHAAYLRDKIKLLKGEK